MSKRPTVKQLRDCLRRMEYHERQLFKAMRDAEDKGVLRFDRAVFENSPFKPYYDLSGRIVDATKDAIAEVQRAEILKGIE